ncbi:MAG: nucleotidyl transferase AbiEii/AbiGii toxin family protein [Polyangiaceae bacterium]|nr:nucleotidyl transferase AbiEii/AbiGii toxin family protein [Polyangiaceae bacterium]
MLSSREAVEFFHLALLGQLASQLDQRLYSVKGGCNLRFFFGSPRYSEDLDLDIAQVAEGTLRNKIERLLSSRPLALVLRTQGVQLERASAPNQPPTTQRWKVGLSLPGQTLHTKLEFSRRGLDEGSEVAPLSPVLCGRYGVVPALVSHYRAERAILQKVRALAGRSETQARDVFDLQHLLGRYPESQATVDDALRRQARERAAAVTSDAFVAQVIAYLPPEEQHVYESEAAFDGMRLACVELLGPGGP